MKFREFRSFLDFVGLGDIDKDEFKDWNLSKLRNNIIKRIKSCNKEIIIWGASQGGDKVLKFLREIGVKPAYFIDIDKNKHGKHENLKVFPPSKIGSNSLVVIGSVFQDEIAKYLEKMSVEYVVGVFDALDSKQIVKKNFSILNHHLDELAEVFNLLFDEESRDIFSSHIKYILTSSPLHIKRSKYAQYFHPLVKPEREDVIVDAGAFDGDTACAFLKYEPEVKKIFSFEADPSNFARLVKNCDIEKIISLNLALWRKRSVIFFKSRLGAVSHISNSGNVSVECVSIDDFFSNRDLTPTLIKMDIEGAELEALKGSAGIIERKKPKLQICIYHKPEHLYEIPIFIKSLNPNYKLFMGHHTGNLAELVVYAV